MARDERPGCERRDVPESPLGEVAQVDEDPQLRAPLHEALPGGGEAGPGIGRGGEHERHAGGEVVRPAPDRAEHAEPRGVPGVERLEIRVDRLGALEAEHRDRPVAVEVGGGPRDADAPGTLEGEEAAGRGGRVRGRRRLRERRRLGELDRTVGPLDRFPPALAGRRGEDREDTAGEAAGRHPGEVDVAAVAPGGERGVVRVNL